MFKKIVMVGLASILSIGLLVGCGERQLPQGVDAGFFDRAIPVFEEINEDTAEGEMPDRDDLNNITMLETIADTPKEQKIVESIKVMNEQFQAIHVDNSKEALQKYLQARSTFGALMEVGLYDFQFVERE